MLGDDSSSLEFSGVKIIDGSWHTFILHLGKLKENKNEVTLYIDCDLAGKPQSLSGRIGRTFNKKALNLAQMRVGQSGLITSTKPLMVSSILNKCFKYDKFDIFIKRRNCLEQTKMSPLKTNLAFHLNF